MNSLLGNIFGSPFLIANNCLMRNSIFTVSSTNYDTKIYSLLFQKLMAPTECNDGGVDDIEDMGLLGDMVNTGESWRCR